MVDTHGTDVMSLSDIAALAHVKRSVVSMWRQRTTVRGEHIPDRRTAPWPSSRTPLSS